MRGEHGTCAEQGSAQGFGNIGQVVILSGQCQTTSQQVKTFISGATRLNLLNCFSALRWLPRSYQAVVREHFYQSWVTPWRHGHFSISGLLRHRRSGGWFAGCAL
jgi:hypothetical protein